MSEIIKWSELTELQKNAIVAEKVFGWQWIAYDYYDSSQKNQLWLLPDGQSVADLAPGEWTYYLEEPTVYPEGSAFPLPHKDKRHLPDWIPNYTANMSDAWDIVEHITQPPRNVEEADRAANSRFGFWFDKANLWTDDAASAAERICVAALRAVGVEIED